MLLNLRRTASILNIFSHLLLFSCLFSYSQAQLVSSILQKQDSVSNEVKKLKKEATKLVKEEKLDEAIKNLEDAVIILSQNNSKDKSLLFELYIDLENIYGHESLKDIAKMAIYHKKAEDIIAKYKVSTIALINYYIAISANYSDKFQDEKALGYINKAYTIITKQRKDLIKEIGKKSAVEIEGNVLEWFVSLNQKLSNEAELLDALAKFERFYNAYKTYNNLDNYYTLANFRAGRYYQNSNVDKAVYYFDKSYATGDSNMKLYSIICSSIALLNVQKYDKAYSKIKVLESFKDLNQFQKLNVHEIAARYYSETKNIPKLIEHTNKGLTLLNAKKLQVDVLNFNPNNFEPLEALRYPILLTQFSLFMEESEYSRLLDTTKDLYKIGLEQFVNRLDQEGIKNRFNSYNTIKNRILNQLISPDTSIEEKKYRLSQIEQIETKASFNNLLINRALVKTKRNLDSLFDYERNLRSQITELKKNQITNDTIYKQELFELELEIAKVDKKIKKENPAIHSLVNKEFSFQDLNLNDEIKILKYTKAEDEIFRIEISATRMKIVKLGMYQLLEDNVNTFLTALKNQNKQEKIATLSRELYTYLFHGIDLTESTIIIADEILAYLPFEVLKKDNNYLINLSSVSYANGLSYLNKTEYANINHTKNVSFFVPSYSKLTLSDEQLSVRGEAYDLKGAKEEVDLLSELTDGTIYKNLDASKTKFLNLNDDYAIIHMAGHAFLNDEDPELSSLIFSDNTEDNKLFISELYGFKSNANLAVLSACNTGVGGYTSGKGVVSLSQAFMYSGIPATVSSLWSAPDQSTKAIMISFYSYLKDGLSKSKALQAAKLDYLSNTTNPKLKHPYYWAGFVLYGNDSPIEFLESSMSFYYWVIIAVLVVSAFYFLKQKLNKRIANDLL